MKRIAILADGAPPSGAASLAAFKSAGMLVACDGAWRVATGLGRVPDAVVGDGDSLGAEGEEALARMKIPFFGYREQDTNDLCKAFRHVLGLAGPDDRIVILGATGKREDHSIGNIFRLADFAQMLAEKGMPADAVSIVTDSGAFHAALPPGRTWHVRPGTAVSVFAAGPDAGMSSTGLEWPLAGADLRGLWRGTLNRASGGSFTIRTNGPAIVYIAGEPVFPDYEISGIETIARGVCVRDGRLLVCRAKGGNSSYLPGGHIEFGETGREALVREIKEELGLESNAGRFLGAVENSFMQKGKRHAEINLVYELDIDDGGKGPDSVGSKEAWIEFEWCPLGNLEAANLLPEAFRSLSAWPDVAFSC